MKPFKKFLLFLIFNLFYSPILSAVNIDWSGWTRLDSYYQHENSYYGEIHFVLNSNIFVTDNLSFKSRIDLFPLFKQKNWLENFDFLEKAYRQTGYVFLYQEEGKKRQSDFPLAFIIPSQFYADYEEEFFKIRLGRAPYHFGLGTTYSASNNPFEHWMSLYNQLSVHLEYNSFYLQPSLLHDVRPSLKGEVFLALQTGLSQKNWKISALYQHHFKKDDFLEFFGHYKDSNWDLKTSASYLFKTGLHFSLALEGKMSLATPIPIILELKTGGLSGDIVFHPNYDLALIFWNRFIDEKQSLDKYPYKIATAQVKEGLYFSPRLIFSFLDGNWQVEPLFLLAGSLQDKKLSYEWDLNTRYQWDENLFFSLTAGALYSSKKLYLSLMAQTAASF
ncbi:MAG: hypothetical protein OXC37_00350 [Bdellovibrionaceae bacterium]|nr:hypothetical protein [Pseudobdellovibrionaceae bacterium]